MDLGVDHAVTASPPAFGAEAEPAHAADSDSDSEDLGPETAVDADDAEPPHAPSPLHIDKLQPKVEQTQIDGTILDNVGDSGEDSEDEWNYYKGEGEEEGQTPAEEPDEPPLSETPCQDTSAWESSSVDMNSSPLNPDAPVFVPGTAGDVLLAESPRKPLPMDDLEVPDQVQFKTEAVERPAELLDLDDCDQLNGHHNVSVHSTNMEHLNGNKCDMDSLGFGFNVKSEKDKDGVLIETFERIQKDTTDFCNLQVFQAQNDSNPFADNEEIFERLKNKESDPMSMSFYQEKDDDTCERLVHKNTEDILNSVQPLPESDEDDDLKHNGISTEDEANKENVIPSLSTFEHSNSQSLLDRLEPDNNLLDNNRIENLSNNDDNIQRENTDNYDVERRTICDSVLDFGSNNTPHETVAQTDTPESHKLLFEQIPEIPDGKTSEIEFVNVEEVTEEVEGKRPESARNDVFDEDFEINHNETENTKNNYTPEHILGISKAEIEYSRNDIDSDIDPLLSTIAKSDNTTDEIKQMGNSSVHEDSPLKDDNCQEMNNMIDHESSELLETKLPSTEVFSTESTDFSTSTNVGQIEPDVSVFAEEHLKQSCVTESVENVFKIPDSTTAETCSYEKEEIVESHFNNAAYCKSPVVSSSHITSVGKQLEETLIDSENKNQVDFIHTESHIATSTINDHLVDPLLPSSQDNKLNESGETTMLTSQFEGLSIKSPDSLIACDEKIEAMTETSGAPDIVPEATTNDHLVTDVDIGVPESRAQEICMPVASEILPQEVVAADLEAKSNDPVRPPSLDLSSINAALLTVGGAVAAAAVAVQAARTKSVVKAEKTPTSATKPAKPTTVSRTPASASKKTTATPTAKTPASVSKTTPAKTPTSASKLSATKAPANKTAPAKEATKATAAPRTLVSKPTQSPVGKPSPIANKPSPITSKPSTIANKAPLAASKITSATSKPPAATTKPTSATTKSTSAATKTTSAATKMTSAATKPASTASRPTSTTAKSLVAATKPAASKPLSAASKPAAPRPAPARAAPTLRVPLSARPASAVAEKKPLTNGDVKAPAKKPLAPRPAPARVPPRPATAPSKIAATRAPLDKTGKELANKKATTKAPVNLKSATPNGVAKKAELKSRDAAPSPPAQPAAPDALLPDVIA